MTVQPQTAAKESSSVIPQFPQLQELIAANEKWAAKTKSEDPELLQALSKGQVSLLSSHIHTYR